MQNETFFFYFIWKETCSYHLPVRLQAWWRKANACQNYCGILNPFEYLWEIETKPGQLFPSPFNRLTLNQGDETAVCRSSLQGSTAHWRNCRKINGSLKYYAFGHATGKRGYGIWLRYRWLIWRRSFGNCITTFDWNWVPRLVYHLCAERTEGWSVWKVRFNCTFLQNVICVLFDSFQGDEGGPIISNNTQIGITIFLLKTSDGKLQSEKVAIFTRLTNYVGGIQDILKMQVNC